MNKKPKSVPFRRNAKEGQTIRKDEDANLRKAPAGMQKSLHNIVARLQYSPKSATKSSAAHTQESS